MSGDYKVLVVVDLQNCFIQGGSLGSQNIEDLKKYIDLVKEVDNKIHQNNYDLVVFSKDSHPLNHSSLSDNTDAEHGVFNYHCRNTKKNCIKDTKNPTTYISSVAKNIIRENLCVRKDDTIKKNFYDKKIVYDTGDYNFYNPTFKNVFKLILTNLVSKTSKTSVISEIRREMDDKKYDINYEKNKTLEDLLRDYISNPKLDDDSKGYLKGILENEEYKGLKVQGLDLNYLFYNTQLKNIIFALNTNTDSEIGIKKDKYTSIPNYNDTAYKVDSLVPKTFNNTKDTKFITIEKGQYCDYESYSAFNYHTKIEKDKTNSIIYDVFKKYDSSLNVLEKLPAEKRYSTGLFEYILKDFKDQDGSKTNINIDVCGLVTNICVINTVHQGIAMWEKVYKGENQGITCKFNLLEYLSIPLPIDIPIPHLNYNYAQQIKKEKDFGRMLLQVSNLKTLFTTKFKDDVLEPNPDINDVISYTVDFDVDLDKEKITEYINQINQIKENINNSSLNFTHTNPSQDGGKKLKRVPKTPRAAPKTPRAAPKTPRAAPKTPKAAPKTPKAAPKTPKAAPKTPRAVPKKPREAPKKAPRAAPKH